MGAKKHKSGNFSMPLASKIFFWHFGIFLATFDNLDFCPRFGKNNYFIWYFSPFNLHLCNLKLISLRKLKFSSVLTLKKLIKLLFTQNLRTQHPVLASILGFEPYYVHCWCNAEIWQLFWPFGPFCRWGWQLSIFLSDDPGLTVWSQMAF